MTETQTIDIDAALAKGAGKKAIAIAAEHAWQFAATSTSGRNVVHLHFVKDDLQARVDIEAERRIFLCASIFKDNNGETERVGQFYRMVDFNTALFDINAAKAIKERQREADRQAEARKINAASALAAYKASAQYANDERMRARLTRWAEADNTFTFDATKTALQFLHGEADQFAVKMMKRELAIATLAAEGTVKEYAGDEVAQIHTLQSAAQEMCNVALRSWDAERINLAHCWVKAVNELRYECNLR